MDEQRPRDRVDRAERCRDRRSPRASTTITATLDGDLRAHAQLSVRARPSRATARCRRRSIASPAANARGHRAGRRSSAPRPTPASSATSSTSRRSRRTRLHATRDRRDAGRERRARHARSDRCCSTARTPCGCASTTPAATSPRPASTVRGRARAEGRAVHARLHRPRRRRCRACPITVTRTYDSRDKGKGDFGVGWRLDVQTLRLRTNRVLGTGWTTQSARHRASSSSRSTSTT